MKNFYTGLAILSFLCVTGESDSLLAILVWDAVWIAVALFSIHQLDRLEEKA